VRIGLSRCCHHLAALRQTPTMRIHDDVDRV
jgi:hypothetical protein